MPGGLRYETGREMPPGMQELFAKHIIEEIVHSTVQVLDSCVQAVEETVEKITEDERAVMLEVIKAIDEDCAFCLYAGGKLPCAEESITYSCAGCQYDCPCKGCRENSKYEWCGTVEALMRLVEMTKK